MSEVECACGEVYEPACPSCDTFAPDEGLRAPEGKVKVKVEVAHWIGSIHGVSEVIATGDTYAEAMASAAKALARFGGAL